ncbi:uncharacterized protein LOC110007896 isoform X2 [Amborella trichopoda]|uniref:uncharacterized protein LOC110007896 isoform X2 n=1 Tax=Amborella trichopoda TaxID=13333 RepID=UPI0009C033E8|nr:uncharacterized protein LOC110007896 isoform X2 [Amborella trichopoda]|eukprot:XP_020527592.1 uncharacterized protein LOC110007896 isoform X2 [Amborella trichopoda]
MTVSLVTILETSEISFVSEILKELNRPILQSIFPGKSADPEMAAAINKLIKMYRITVDNWDEWEDVQGHFDFKRDFAKSGLIGAGGFLGKSWPDMDMLPLGWISKSDDTMFHTQISFNVWRELRKIDSATLNLITNSTLLEINYFCKNNMESPTWSQTP